ncbi:MAG: hypothetical protein M3R17_18075 [Bacteroidota bacterium]|nr:hypothetical protein [Bacteroidota bacterium]
MNACRFIFFVFLCCTANPLTAQKNLFRDSASGNKFLFEVETGIGLVNYYSTQPSFSFHAGTGNYVLTARFLRSQKGINFIYENCWLAGYRFTAKKYLNATLSAGAGDLAFLHKGSSFYDQEKLHEVVGLTLDAEMQFNIYTGGQPSRWLIYANYYTTFNSYNNVNGFTFGLGYSPGKKRWKSYDRMNEDANAKRNRQLAETKRKNEAKQLQRSVRNAQVREHTNELHWEGYAFAGTAQRPFVGGFGTFFELKKIILGANFSWESQVLWKESYHQANYPPNIVSYHHFKGKQSEKAIFAGYRIWESRWFGLSVAAGPVWKKSITLMGDEISYRMWYSAIETKTVTGLTVQSELSFTFQNRAFGFGMIPFVNIYKGYTSVGGVVSMRFGFLR